MKLYDGKHKMSRYYRALIMEIKKFLKFNTFDDVFNDDKSEKKGHIHIETFLDIIDIRMKLNKKYFTKQYYKEALEKDGEYVNLKKLR
jgi:hypothetical protein